MFPMRKVPLSSPSHFANGIEPLPVSDVKCPHCNASGQQDARFCSQCGKQVADLNPPEPAPPAPPPAPPPGPTLIDPLSITCNCGQILPPGAAFCFKCGLKIGPQKAAFHLVCRMADGRNFSVELTQEGVMIGKGNDCSVALSNDAYVSRRHAQLRLVDGRVVLEDLNSSNGTFLRVRDPVAVQPGTEFLVGTTTFRLEKVHP